MKVDNNGKQNSYKIGDIGLLNAKRIIKFNFKFRRNWDPYNIKRISDLAYEFQRCLSLSDNCQP